MITTLTYVALGTLLLTSACMPIFLRMATRWGLLDHPTERSSHHRIVPRGGGLVILVSATVAAALIGAPMVGGAVAVAAGTVLVGGVGLWDDRRGLSPVTRLAFQSLAAVLVIAATGGLSELPLPPPMNIETGIFGAGLGILWIVAVVNFYNFLDGIDGLAGLQGAVTGVGIAAAAWSPFSAVFSAALAGGCLGFLLYNWSPARIFMGDVGSGALGFFFAASPFLAPEAQRSRAVTLVALSLWFFLADATLTLGRRLARGARVYKAHREHVYQQLIIGGMSHANVTILLGSAAAILTSTALAAWWRVSAAWAWVAIALAAVTFLAELELARRITLKIAPREAGS